MTKQQASKAAADIATVRASGVRVVKAGIGRPVTMPQPIDGNKVGVTFAHWTYDNVKRRAYLVGDLLVIDKAGVSAETMAALARVWKSSAKVADNLDSVVVYTSKRVAK